MYFYNDEEFERAPDMDNVYLNDGIDKFPKDYTDRMLGHHWTIYRHKKYKDVLAFVRPAEFWPGDSRPLVFFGWWNCPVTMDDLKGMMIGCCGPEGHMDISTEITPYGSLSWHLILPIIELVEGRKRGEPAETLPMTVDSLTKRNEELGGRVKKLEELFDGVFVSDDKPLDNL